MPLWLFLLLVGPTATDAEAPSFVVRLQAAGRPEIDVVAASVAAKARETWQAEVLLGPEDAAVVPRFAVRLEWRESALIEVWVLEAERELSARQIRVDEPGAARLLVWLVVRSSIDRALLDATLPAEPARSSSGPELAAAVTSPAVAVAPPVAVPELLRGFAFGLAMTGAWGWPQLVGVGPSVALAYHGAPGWLGLEVGYLLTPMVDTGRRAGAITLHELRLAALAGLALPSSSIWSVGLTGVVAFERAATQTRSAGGVGVDAGGFVQARLPLAGAGAAAIARLSFAGRPLRHRYLVDGGRVREGPVATGLTLGACWP